MSFQLFTNTGQEHRVGSGVKNYFCLLQNLESHNVPKWSSVGFFVCQDELKKANFFFKLNKSPIHSHEKIGKYEVYFLLPNHIPYLIWMLYKGSHEA